MVGARLITPRERLAIIVGFAVLWLASTGTLVWYANRIDSNGQHTAQALTVAEEALAKARAQEGSQRLAQIATCKRGNERTVAENVSNLADWRFFSSTAALLKATLTRRPPGQPAPTSEQISETRHFIGGLEADARDKVWHHLIENCGYAIDHPETFALPRPVPFSKRRPPKGALHVAPGE